MFLWFSISFSSSLEDVRLMFLIPFECLPAKSVEDVSVPHNLNVGEYVVNFSPLTVFDYAFFFCLSSDASLQKYTRTVV